MSPPRYTVTETLFDDGRTRLCRAVRAADQRTVILKAIDPRRSRVNALERLRHEYEIGSTLDLGAIVRPLALETQGVVPALVLEDFDGQPLDRFLGAPMGVETFLDLAVRIAGAIADVHRQGVVHRDLKPENILVHPGTFEVRIVDFGLATRVPREQQLPQPPQLIEGSLPYLSPEQTGRMNRAVDSRSDLYSLGVTFYRMLTGRLPFEARDPLDWVHCHVARAPTSPSQLVPALPEVIARIVMKLLAKMADDRYQSAEGVRHDLQRCLEQLRSQGRIDPCPLGEWDTLDRLQLPQKLYGRDEERARLLGTFERIVANRAPGLLLVSGYAGIGKSSLVHELLQPLVRERGLFLEGKFDQYARNVPYSTIVQAFTRLVLDMLVESEERLEAWKQAIQHALEGNAKLITDVIPPLKLLIGEPPSVPELPPIEAERRFRRVFCAFVGVFGRDGPLVLFLDDLQWADPASLGLIEALVTDPRTRHLLLVGAFRDNEVSRSHPLTLTLDRIRKSPAIVTDIVLAPLRMEHLVQLVADAVRADAVRVAPLATLVHRKTGGNPFFVMQFLTTLSQELLLEFDQAQRGWRWDLPRIEQQGYTDNVVDFLVRTLTALPPATQHILETAACVGNRASLGILASVHGKPEDDTVRDLWEAVREGLVFRDRDTVAFAHDRVQQAAYSLVPEERRSEMHLRIGRLLLERVPMERRDEQIFEIVTQLNLGRGLLTDSHERDQLAELNLHAGRKARAAAAYASAIAYLSAGEAMLPPDGWDSRYELTYALHIERAWCEWLCSHFEVAAGLLPSLMAHARGRVDLAAVHRVEITLHTTRGEPERAARTALAACAKLFGIDLPLHPTEAALREAAERTWRELGPRSIQDLIELPAMADAEMQAAVTLLSASLPPAYFTDPMLHDLMCCEIVSLSLRYGNSDFSPHGYVTFGATLGRLFDRWEEAHRFGVMACELIEKRGTAQAKASTYFTVGTFIHFWVRPLREVMPFFTKSLAAAVEHGDINHACYAALSVVLCRLMIGDPLADVATEAEAQLDLARRAKYDDVRAGLAGICSSIRKLRGDPDRQIGDFEIEAGAHGIGHFSHYTYQALTHLLMGNHQSALVNARKVTSSSNGGVGRGQIQEAEHCYVTALALAAHLDHAPAEERKALLTQLAWSEEQFRRWERHCPANFRDRRALVSAERARLECRDLEAMRLYEEAIQSARENAFVRNEAVSQELAAAFYRSRGFDTIANAYLAEARSSYLRWGADAKVRDLERRHPYLVETRAFGRTSSFVAKAEHLDLVSVVKASQTISSEIVVENLVRTLLQVVLQEGGAQRGCLIVCRDGRLFVEAEARVDGEGLRATILDSVPVETSALVPASIVSYVQRTKDRVILDDGTRMAKLAADEYFARRSPRSVLCLPIMKQSEVVGLLYLENDLGAGAFTPTRLATLTLLASQAAISIENARLLAQERVARAVAEEAERRAAFLSDVGALLSESLEYDETLARLSRLCVRSLADWCIIDIVDGREIRRVAGAHADPSKESLLNELQRFPPSWESPHPAARCLRSGEPLWMPEVLDDDLRATCEGDEHVRLVAALGTRSAVAVPLVARGQKLGALTLCSGTTGRYARADLEVAREVARRAAIAIDNARLYREAQRAVQTRDDFLMVASHELRTPMASLTLSLQSLRRAVPSGRSVDPRVMNRFVELSVRQGERLNRLIGDLLDVSRIERGRLPLELAEVDLEELVRDVVERLEPELARVQCPLSIRTDARAAGRWDRSRIDQVVTNLLSNAIKFGAGRPIDIRIAAQAGIATLEVRDHGIGIDPSQQAGVFERFGRAASSLNYGGLGLGLYISRGIVEAHGGTVRVVSQPGAGSTFTVELPCSRPAADASAP